MACLWWFAVGGLTAAFSMSSAARWRPEKAFSFHPDPELLDDRPPFLGVGLNARAESLRRLLVPRKNVHSEIGETGLHHRIGQCLHDRRIELPNDVPRRALGRKKSPPGQVG